MIKGYDFGKYEDRIAILIEACNTVDVERIHNEYLFLKNVSMKDKDEVFAIDYLEQEVKMVYFRAIDLFSYEIDKKKGGKSNGKFGKQQTT
ncbi:MAG: hypothetical protein SOY48_08675 [Eubacterium sp.]|nr:hypothetical protein [Eubacterium sp.]